MKYKKKTRTKTRAKLRQTGAKQNAHKLPEIVKKLDNEQQKTYNVSRGCDNPVKR